MENTDFYSKLIQAASDKQAIANAAIHKSKKIDEAVQNLTERLEKQYKAGEIAKQEARNKMEEIIQAEDKLIQNLSLRLTKQKEAREAAKQEAKMKMDEAMKAEDKLVQLLSPSILFHH